MKSINNFKNRENDGLNSAPGGSITTLTNGKVGGSDFIIKRFTELRTRYTSKSGYENEICDMVHAGKSFYMAYNDDFFGPMMKTFHNGFPIYLSFIHNGTNHYIATFYDGYAKIETAKLEEDKLEYIKKNKAEMDRVKKKLLEWINSNKILKGKSIKYYIRKIQQLYSLLLEVLPPYELSIFINPYLEEKFNTAFNNLKISKDDLLKLSVSEEPISVEIHESMVDIFLKNYKKSGYDFSKSEFKKIIKDSKLKKHLTHCYQSGYFLHSAIGGVTLWTMEDEFNEIMSNPQKKNEKVVKKNSNEYYSFTKEQKEWIETSRHFSFQRDERKTSQQKIFYIQAQCLEEISKKIDMPRTELEYLKPSQLSEALLKKKNALLEKINLNKKGHLFMYAEGAGYFISFGDEAINIYNSLKRNIEQNNIIMGQTANKGFAKGIAKIIYNTKEKFDFNEGDILITGMTYPDFVPLRKKAAAIVTDIGGITCHAAILSREINKPCVIGTKFATRNIKNGDLVEVDADNGIVRIVRK
jgi:phosphohistidine swiveling domain-containing protein